MVQNSNGQPTRNTAKDKVLRMLLFPVVIILYLPMKVMDFFAKSKNRRKYKSAAYLTLNSKTYKPCFSDLYYCFRAGGLSVVDSSFNAVYMLKSEKLYRNDSQKTEEGIYEHPAGWHEKERARIERCANAFSLKFLTALSYVLSLPSKIASKMSLKKLAHLLVPVAAAAAVFFAISLSSDSTVVINAYINGEHIGTAAQMDDFTYVINTVQADVSEVLDGPYKYSAEITYEITEEKKPVFTDKETLYNALFSYTTDYVRPAAGLYIDGELVAVCESAQAAERAINSVLEVYKEKSGKTRVKIADSVKIEEKLYPTADIVCGNSFASLFNTDFDYVSEAETICDPVIAMSIEQRGIVNVSGGGRSLRNIPSVDGAEVLTLSTYINDAELLELPFETSQVVTYHVNIPYEKVVKEDANFYPYYSATLQRGADGRAEVTAEIVYINGLESERIILNEKVAIAPIDQITVVGVKPYPETLGLDSEKVFILPHYGYISSYFGSRTLRGSYNYHRGVDIPGAKGTPVHASASGTVIMSEYNGAFGNYIIIDHGNGLTSHYAHMSKLIAQVGDKVNQGDTIGLIGTTGDSTGNHVHFEIRKDGQHVDPMKYIYE